MQLPVSALIAWFTVIWFSLIHKRLSILDFVFLYCTVLVITTTTHTVFDVDLQLVTIPRNPVASFATIISRMITIPLLIMIAVNALYVSESRMSRWGGVLLCWVALSGFDWLLNQLHVITYHRWSVWQASLVYVLFIASVYFLMRWFKRGDGRIST